MNHSLSQTQIARIQQRLIRDRTHQAQLYELIDGHCPIGAYEAFELMDVTRLLTNYFARPMYTITESRQGRPVLTLLIDKNNPQALSPADECAVSPMIGICDRAYAYARIEEVHAIEGMNRFVFRRQQQGPRSIWYVQQTTMDHRIRKP